MIFIVWQLFKMCTSSLLAVIIFCYYFRMGVTRYQGIYGFYGSYILKRISRLGLFANLGSSRVLDFGCGFQELRKYTYDMDYVGFDIDVSLSDLTDWTDSAPNVIVINHVLMYLDVDEIALLFRQISEIESVSTVIIGCGTQNIVSTFGKKIFGRPSAHEGTVTSFRIQEKLIYESFEVLRRESVFGLSIIFVAKVGARK